MAADDFKPGNLDRVPASLRPVVQIVVDPVRQVGRTLRSILARLRPRRLQATWRWWHEVAAVSAGLKQEQRVVIAVDAEPLWGSLTGVGWYLSQLLDELKDNDRYLFRLYGPVATHPDLEVDTLPKGSAIQVVRYPAPEDLSLPRHWLSRILLLRSRRLFRDHGNELLFLPNYVAPRRLGAIAGVVPVVVTVHDLAMERYGWTLEDITRRRLHAGLDEVLRASSFVVTPSESVRLELKDSPLFSPALEASGGHGKVVAIAHGPGTMVNLEGTPSSSASPVTQRFALHVGTLEPRKNLRFLLKVWREARNRWGTAVPVLVLVGGSGWKNEELLSEVERGVEEGWVVRPGYVSGEELASLYGSAEFVVSASHYEGFGLPLVEAMAQGRPLLVSDIPVFREVAGEAALFADPTDEESWLVQIDRLVKEQELRQELATRSARRFGEYDWKTSARRHLEVFRRALDQDSNSGESP